MNTSLYLYSKTKGELVTTTNSPFSLLIMETIKTTYTQLNMQSSKNNNFFTFYNLPISFNINEQQLKKAFLKKSKQYHPDFYTQAEEEEKQLALQMSTVNNEAYKTLSNKDERVKYILTLEDVLVPGEKYQLPPSFLMEMMDINEQLMEFEMDKPQKEEWEQINDTINALNNTLMQAAEDQMRQYDTGNSNKTVLSKIKEFYYKKKYLLRIKESLSKFASQ